MGAKREPYTDIMALHPEVTGSCFLNVVHSADGNHTVKFIVDSGIFQELGYNHLNHEEIPFNSSEVKFAIVTHNHADHMARLPLICKDGFRGRIYTTSATAELIRPALSDALQIEKKEAKKQKRKPDYEEEDVDGVNFNTVPCPLEETQYVDPNIKVTFLDNGHILGASMQLVQIGFPEEEDINILYTGDYKPYNIFKKVRKIPEWITELPITVVVEATYGTTETKDVEKHFEKDVERILKEGKSLLTFVFAQGRAQEILFTLKKMQDEGKIDCNIPIYLDGNLSHTYTFMYMNRDLGIDEENKKFIPQNFNLVTKENRAEVFASKEQKIMLTTSGMADHGPAPMYIANFVENHNVAFYLTGYTSEKTLGYKIQHPDNGMIEVDGQELEVNAEILSTGEFSSHAKADELEELLKQFKNLKLVIVNHGQKEIKEKFAQRIQEKHIAKDVEVIGEYVIRTASHGLVKIMGAKLYNEAKASKKRKEGKESKAYAKKREANKHKHNRKEIRYRKNMSRIPVQIGK